MKKVKNHGVYEDINKLIDNSFRVSVGGNGVSFPIGFDSIIYGLEMLERLYEQHLKDSNSKHFYSEDDLTRHPVDNEYFQLKIDFLNRVSSYIILATNINSTISRSYKLHCELLLNEDISLINWKELHDIQKEKLKDLYFIRNKVVAHTSFSDPRKDHVTLQINSLMYLTGQIIGRDENGFIFSTTGGWVWDKVEPQGVDFDIYTYHNYYVSVINDWSKEFLNSIITIEKDRLKKIYSAENILKFLE